MEVKPGYKQTEIGTIPEDWNAVRIGEFLSFKNGLNKAKQFFGIGTPIINYMDVYSYPALTVGKVKGKVTVTADEQRAYSAKRGDVFFTRTSETLDEIGTAAVLVEDIDAAVFSGFVLRGRPNTGVPSLGYRKFCFASESVRQQIVSTSSYTTRALTNGRLLSDVYIPVPPTLAEQEAIAETLSDADALIESLEQLIAKKRQIKQGAMQELLTGKRRLPGFKVKSGYKQTEAGPIPEDWAQDHLGQLGTWKGGATPSMQDPTFWTYGTIPWVSSGDVKHTLISDAPMKITKDAVKNSSTTLLPVDSIIVVTRSGILRKHLPVAKNTLPLAINQDIKALIPSVSHHADFLLHLITWSGRQILATCLKSGTTVESIEFRWLKSFAIPLPPTRAEQDAIASILTGMNTEIDTLEAKLAKAREIKKGMMRELLTGRIRLV